MTDKPHDGIFRKMLSVPATARQILEALLPAEMLAQIDWKTFEMPKIAGINENLSETREDVLYRAKLMENDILFYYLLEHQTDSDRMMPWRILKQTLLIWDEHIANAKKGKKLPLVVPVVVYAGSPEWNYPRRLLDMIEIPDEYRAWAKEFAVDCGIVWLELQRKGAEHCATGPLGRSLLMALQEVQRHKPLDYSDVLNILKELLKGEEQDDVFRLVDYLWNYLLRHSELQKQQIESIVEAVADASPRINTEETKEKLMSTADMLIQEGLEKGRTEGRIGALQADVIEVLEIRFDRVPEGLCEAIQEIQDGAHLRRLLRAAIKAPSIEAFTESL
jgi:predicted transposase/invertase (TIGR01784 family)